MKINVILVQPQIYIFNCVQVPIFYCYFEKPWYCEIIGKSIHPH